MIDETDDLILKAVVICHDTAFATKADVMLRSTTDREEIDVQWIVNCWPVKVLNKAGAAGTALVETLDAHLIVLPASLAQSLPYWLLDWLRRWAAQRQIQDAALGIVNDGNATYCGPSLCPNLSTFIKEQDLNLIIQGGPRVPDSMNPSDRYLHDRETPLSMKGARLAPQTTQPSCRCFGIND